MRAIVTFMAAALLLAGNLDAQGTDSAGARQWVAAPSILSPGALFAVVSGDPTQAGPSTIELAMPDGYVMPPHFHPMDEHVEVVSGTLLVGIGDKVDATHTQVVAVGDTGTAPTGAHHYVIAKGATTIRVRFMGPYIITYVNAYQAPRNTSFPFSY